MPNVSSRIRSIFIAQSARLANEVERARLATNAGAHGEKGKRHNGLYFHQHVGKFVASVLSTYATDAELHPLELIVEGR